MGLFGSGKRKQYVVDSAFRFRFMFTWIIMMLFFIAIVFGGLILGLKMIQRSETYGLGEIGFMLKADAVFIVLFTIVMGIYFLLLSYRIAGPAYRMRRSLQRMIEGDYDFSVNLREKDYLKHIADDLNDLLKILNENKKSLDTSLKDIQKLKSIISDSNVSSEVKNLVNQIEERILKILPKDKPA